jgi:sugar phosphate isomerase/epimerase
MTVQPDLRWCFSTMGCPEASLAEAVSLAAEFLIPAIELRSLSNTIELPKLFSASGWTPPVVRQLCEQNSVQLASAGSSFKLISPDPAERMALAEFCDWANTLAIPYVRIFGGGKWGTPLTDEDFQNAVRNIEWWRAEKSARGWNLELLLETHDAFAASAPCLRLNEQLATPLNLIWDSHHTWRYGGERPTDTWRRIGQFVRHVHFKDSVDQPSARHPYTYVLCGEGQMPLAETIQLLRAQKFTGGVSLEWEKLWHPYMAPLSVALDGLRKQPWFLPASAPAAQDTPALASAK